MKSRVTLIRRRSGQERSESASPEAVPGTPPQIQTSERSGRPVPIPAWKLDPKPKPIPHEPHKIDKRASRLHDIGRVARQSIHERRERMEQRGRTAKQEETSEDLPLIRSLPRRRFTNITPTAPPEIEVHQDLRFRAGFFATSARFFVWLRVLFGFLLNVLWDKIRRRDNTDNRAKHFFRGFQRAGGTFSKIGQQLAMRVDLLPYPYCRELTKLLDNVPPFPQEYAVEAIEKSIGKPLAETFAAFDPKPIGSATIACVYQAILKNGDKVAVKVRRPHIGELFAADINVMRMMLYLCETLTIIRAGYLDNFVTEFAVTILEELDFRMEAYHQSIFARAAKTDRLFKKPFFSAPRVYFELSGRDVLVQEFVTGVWMWEILAAVEHGDARSLARMRQLGIEPQKVAERLSLIQLWGQFMADLFHADPHPANIVVQRDSKLVFIDFGACGSVSKSKQKLTLEYLRAQANKDVGHAVRCMIAFMEPLPPIDLHKFMKELEMAIAGAMHRMWSKHAPWYEKTSAGMFMTLFGITQQYDIPVNLDTVRSFRANMLYDTLATRIYPDIDPMKTMTDFLRNYNQHLIDEFKLGMTMRLQHGGLTGDDVTTLNEVMTLGSRGLGLARRLLDRPTFSFTYLLEKWAAILVELQSMLRTILAVTVIAFSIVAVIHRYHGIPFDPKAIFMELLASRLYLFSIACPAFTAMRRIMMRLRDQER